MGQLSARGADHDFEIAGLAEVGLQEAWHTGGIVRAEYSAIPPLVRGLIEEPVMQAMAGCLVD